MKKEALLIVDDEDNLRESLALLLEPEYTVDTVSSVDNALVMIKNNKYAVILTDIILPQKSGMELLKKIKILDSNAAVVMMTGFGAVETAVKAMKYGAYDYVTKPFKREELLLTLKNVCERRKLALENKMLTEKIFGMNKELKMKVEQRTKKLREINKILEKTYLKTIDALAKAIEAKDPYTHGHSERVTKYSLKLAKKLEIKKGDLEVIQRAGILHDIGKIGIEESILKKKGNLTSKEYEKLKMHPIIGAQIIGSIDYLQKEKEIIKYHHEKYDGTGYPNGLKGEAIPLAARILAVADAYDAMTSCRPYENLMSTEKAKKCLRENAGTQFDKKLVDIFLLCIKDN